jgi:hypothetical protein
VRPDPNIIGNIEGNKKVLASDKAAAQRELDAIRSPRPIEALAAALEQSLRTIHMADPNGHLYGHPRGTSVCRTCWRRGNVDVGGMFATPEVWPCPTIRTVRRLIRAAKS